MARVELSDLTRYGRRVSSVFDLVGLHENDLTAALAFTLARSPALLSLLLAEVGGGRPTAAFLRMETSDADGRTDLEIETPGQLIVVEAKRGWHLPTEEQLLDYVPRIRNHGGGFFVTLSDCSSKWAERFLPAAVDGIPVRHLPWAAAQAKLATARHASRGTERTWLNELDAYLRRVVRVTQTSDMWTYCVVLSNRQFGPHTFREFVTEEGVYFYPFGWVDSWPKEPPNFFAFRWSNFVQRVHRVEKAEITESLRNRWPGAPAGDADKPHVLCTLGPALRMTPLPTGRSYRASHVWVLLDQLFTCSTLAEAVIETDRLR
ncbi:MAG: hypothetical protein ACLP36_12185 [Acidimicrobiales bacterium]